MSGLIALMVLGLSCRRFPEEQPVPYLEYRPEIPSECLRHYFTLETETSYRLTEYAVVFDMAPRYSPVSVLQRIHFFLKR